MLDSFATLSGQMSTLMKQLGSDNLPPLHNHVLLPLQVSSDKDPDLEVRKLPQEVYRGPNHSRNSFSFVSISSSVICVSF